MKEFSELFYSELPGLATLSNSFKMILHSTVKHSAQEIEKFKLFDDREFLLKDQLKRNILKHILELSNLWYRFAGGNNDQE
ncbi:hypothetical protein JW877_03205 [bacterium]|nr:hypothetical protein [bacterium]